MRVLGPCVIGVWLSYATALHAQTTERALPRGAVTLVAPPAASEPVAPHATPPDDTRAPLRVPLALSGAGRTTAGELHVITEGAGRILGGGTEPALLELPRAGRVVVSSDGAKDIAARSQIAAGRKTALPWLVLDTRVQQGQTSVRASRPFLELKQAIAWDPSTRSHIATLLFGMEREGGEGPATDSDALLEPPLLARFAVSCDEVSPDAARVTQLGVAGYQTLRITCSARATRTTREHSVQVLVGTGKLRYPLTIPKQAGPLALLASSSRVPGLGFGSTTLSIMRSELDGSPLPADADLPVQLTARGGNIDASTLLLERGQSNAQITIHPSGLGRIELEAVAEGQRSTPIALEVVFPWSPVLATLLGGVLGGYLSVLVRRRQRRQPALERIVEGVLVAAIIAGCMLILPAFTPLPSWARMSELGMFVSAALASFVGAPLLGRATHAMFPTLSAEEPARAHR